MLFLFSLCRLRFTAELRSGAVDKIKWPVFFKMHLATLDKPPLLQNLEKFALQIQSKSVTLSEILKYTIVRANTN